MNYQKAWEILKIMGSGETTKQMESIEKLLDPPKQNKPSNEPPKPNKPNKPNKPSNEEKPNPNPNEENNK